MNIQQMYQIYQCISESAVHSEIHEGIAILLLIKTKAWNFWVMMFSKMYKGFSLLMDQTSSP